MSQYHMMPKPHILKSIKALHIEKYSKVSWSQHLNMKLYTPMSMECCVYLYWVRIMSRELINSAWFCSLTTF